MAEANDDEFRRSRRSDFIRSLFGDHTTRECSEMLNWWYSADESKRIKALMAQRDVFIKEWPNERITVQDDALKIKIHKRNTAYHVASLDTVMYKLRYVDQCKLEALMIDNWPTIREMLLADTPTFGDDVFEGIIIPHLNSILALVAPEDVQGCSSASEFVSAIKWLLRAKELPKLKEHVFSDEIAREEAAKAKAIDTFSAIPKRKTRSMTREDALEHANDNESNSHHDIVMEDAPLEDSGTDAKEVMQAIANMRIHSPWTRTIISDTEISFSALVGPTGPPGRFVSFSIKNDRIVFKLYANGREVPLNDQDVVTCVEDVKKNLSSALSLSTCPGFQLSNIPDTYYSGFRIVVSMALRNAATLLRASRSLSFPTVGVLFARRTQDTREQQSNDDGELNCDADVGDTNLAPASPTRCSVSEDVAFVPCEEKISMVCEKNASGHHVLRSVDCSISAPKGSRCEACAKRCAALYRKCGNEVAARKGEQSKYQSHAHLLRSPNESRKAMARLATEKHQLQKQLLRWAEQKRNKNGVLIEDMNDHRFLDELHSSADDEAKRAFADNPEALAVWRDQQENCRRAAQHNGKRLGCRYSPDTIRVALALNARVGTDTYSKLAGIFLLPSGRYIRQFRNFAAEDNAGIMETVIRANCAAADDRGLNKEGDRIGCLTFDAMTIKGGVWFEYHTGRILGFSVDNQNHSVVLSEFMEKAKEENTKKEKKNSKDDTTRLKSPAKHYLVFYFVGLGADHLVFPVARYALGSITGDWLLDTFLKVTIELEAEFFHVVVAAFDGAGENRSFAKKAAKIPASELLKGFNVQFDTSFLIALRHPITGEPIILCADMPHIIKKIRNALEASNVGNGRERQLMMRAKGDNCNNEFQPLCLDMAREIWQEYEDHDQVYSDINGPSALRITKLTNDHFELSAFSKMKVSLATQVMSNTMCRMIDHVRSKDNFKYDFSLFQPYRDLCFHVNRIVDIMNGRTEVGYGNISSIEAKELTELAESMKWFEDWQRSVATAPLPNAMFTTEEQRKAAFLPDECWYDINALLKGVVCFCVYYLQKYPNLTIVQRRIMQDIVEHHFAHVRAACGAGAHPTLRQAHNATTTSAAMRFSGSSKNTNCNDKLHNSDLGKLFKKGGQQLSKKQKTKND